MTNKFAQKYNATEHELALMEPVYKIIEEALSEHMPQAGNAEVTLLGQTFSIIASEYLGKIAVHDETNRQAEVSRALEVLGEILLRISREVLGANTAPGNQFSK